MSFWKTSTGEEAYSGIENGSFETGGGVIEPIPANTNALAFVEEAKWETNANNACSYISLRWTILAPEEYKNRKVFQKLWVSDLDPSSKNPEAKRDKALMMLAAIDFNAGGKLKSSGGSPSDEAMQVHLCNKPMMIKIQQWAIKNEMTGETSRGNWISAVSPKGSAKAETPTQTARNQTIDDVIPF